MALYDVLERGAGAVPIRGEKEAEDSEEGLAELEDEGLVYAEGLAYAVGEVYDGGKGYG